MVFKGLPGVLDLTWSLSCSCKLLSSDVSRVEATSVEINRMEGLQTWIKVSGEAGVTNTSVDLELVGAHKITEKCSFH